MNSKNTKFKFNSLIVTAVVIIAVIFINLIVTALAAKINLKLDMTRSQKIEITEQTQMVMKSLDKIINVKVVGKKDEINLEIAEYLDRYSAMNANFKVSYIDVEKNQSVLYAYIAKGETLHVGDVVLEYADRYKIVSASSLYKQELSTVQGENKYNFDLEMKLTNAVVTLTGTSEESVVYILEGHSEATLSYLNTLLGEQGYKVQTLNILNSEIPADAMTLVSCIPAADYTAEECEKINAFLQGGGNLMVITTAGTPDLPRLEAYLAEWGIEKTAAIVVEHDADKMYNGIPFAIMADAQQHEITASVISQKTPVLFNESVGYDVQKSNAQNAVPTVLVTSSDKSVGKANLDAETAAYEEGDDMGPVGMAVLSEKENSKVMVIGSASAVEFSAQYPGNAQLISSAVSYLTDNGGSLKIAPKVVTEGKITNLTKTGINVMYYSLVFIFPAIILAVGITIWLKRRYL